MKISKNYFTENRLPIKEILLFGFFPSIIKKLFYRLKKYKVGRNVKFSFGSLIIAKNNCSIGEGTIVGFFSIIIVNKLTIGNNCRIRSFTFIKTDKMKLGNDVIISENVKIRAGHPSPYSSIDIESRVHIFPYAILDTSYPIHIGEESCIGFYTDIYTHGAYKNILEGYSVSYGAVDIGKRVELTYKVFVAPGVSIKDDVQVAYGSYVNKDLPYGVLAAGTPAKIKRVKDEFAPTPSYEKKIIIINNIIDSFCEYLKYYDKCSSQKKIEKQWVIKNGKDKTNIFLNVEDSEKENCYNENDIVICFNKVSSSYREYLIINKIQLFDLKQLMCVNLITNYGKEIRSYFGRYGIRFKEDY